MKFRVEHTFRSIALVDDEPLYFNEELNTALGTAFSVPRRQGMMRR
ncbi:MAG: hypothetical protein V3T05_00110 [Myxococcota bacterium]